MYAFAYLLTAALWGALSSRAYVHKANKHRPSHPSDLVLRETASRAALEEAQVDDLGLQPELALVLDEALLLLRRREKRDGVALAPLARGAARDVHVRVEARG